MIKRFIAMALVLAMLFMLASCGKDEKSTTTVSNAAQPSSQVTLRIVAMAEDSPAFEWAAIKFNEIYPECKVVYEYLQGDYNDAVLERMASPGDDRIDIFVTSTNLQAGHDLNGKALNLYSRDDLDFSNTFQSLINNAMFIEEDGSASTKLYAVPLGAQMRGLFVNVSLLNEVGITEIPKNQAELLEDCRILKEAGYVPFNGNPGMFSQQLLYPWICNNIVNADNYEQAYNLVNTRDAAATELFRDVYEFMYTLVENDYYDYIYSREELNICTDSGNGSYARSLLNIVDVLDDKGEKTGEYVKGEGNGQVAFMPNAISLIETIDEYKEDYHSEIEYKFIPAPVGKDGGYVYLSPADFIGINAASEKIDWAVKFLDFLFQPENNEKFSELYHIIPNTKEAFAYVESLYDVPINHIAELGKATFDWKFYNVLTKSTSTELMALPAISKANNPKNFNPETNEMYPFDYFWDKFVSEFTGSET